MHLHQRAPDGFGKDSRVSAASKMAITSARISGRAAIAAMATVACPPPARARLAMLPGRSMRKPLQTNIVPFTMAAEVPIWSGRTTSPAVLNASMCAAAPTPNKNHNTIDVAALSWGR